MRFFNAAICLLIVMGISACSEATPTEEVTSPTNVAQNSLVTDPQQATTEAVTPVSTLTPSPTPVPTETNTPVPTETPVPPTSTPTPEPDPVVRLNETITEQINVRAGPGTNYPVLDTFEPGEIAIVIGRNADKSWWRVKLEGAGTPGWVYARLVKLTGIDEQVPLVDAAPPPEPTPEPIAQAEAATPAEEPTEAAPPTQPAAANKADDTPVSPEELADQLRCGKDFCITYQAMVPIWENGGCIGNHSIYVTVLEGLPPGRPLDGIVVGDTFNNVEVASGSKGPGQAELTLWMNTMSVKVKRHIDGTEYTSEESFPFTSHDELIPAEVLAANGYCDGSVEKCRVAQQHNQVCRGHYSYRVTFHKFD